MPEVDLNRKPLLTINSTLTFGKYKGETAKHVLETDPSYLIWVYENIEWLTVDDDLLELCEDAIEEKKRGISWSRR